MKFTTVIARNSSEPSNSRLSTMKLISAVALTMFGTITAAAEIPTLQDRRLGAIVGSMLVDAAVMPLHWIYNTTEIAALVGSKNPEFFDPPSCPFYNYSLGENSPYGQQSRAYLKQLAGAKSLDTAKLAKAYFDFFGGAGKDAPCVTHATEDHPCPPQQTGVPCCYWDGSTRGFMENVNQTQGHCITEGTCGVLDTQGNAMTHMVLAVSRGTDSLEQALADTETIIRITQNADEAVAFGSAAARVLHKAIFKGLSARESVSAGVAELLDSNRISALKQDFFLGAGGHVVMEEFATSNAAVTLQVTGTPTEAFTNATRQIIMAGGDQASRGMFIGAVLGAVAGESGLPQEFKNKYVHYEEVLQLAKGMIHASETTL